MNTSLELFIIASQHLLDLTEHSFLNEESFFDHFFPPFLTSEAFSKEMEEAVTCCECPISTSFRLSSLVNVRRYKPGYLFHKQWPFRVIFASFNYVN